MIDANECFLVEKELFKKTTCRANDMDDSRTNVQHINITVSENDVVKGARSILEVIRPVWHLDEVKFKVSIFCFVLFCLFTFFFIRFR